MTEHNKDNMSIERRNIGERSTTTENGMHKLPVRYDFLIAFSFEVPQINLLTQAHNFQINDTVFNSANTVSN